MIEVLYIYINKSLILIWVLGVPPRYALDPRVGRFELSLGNCAQKPKQVREKDKSPRD